MPAPNGSQHVEAVFSDEQQEFKSDSMLPVAEMTSKNEPDVDIHGAPDEEADSPRTDEGQLEKDDRALGTTRFRFVILAIFSAYALINQIMYSGFAFVVRPAQDRYGVDALMINILSMIIPVLYVILVLPGCYVYNLLGFRYGGLIGIAATAVAGLFRFISIFAPEYGLLVVGQVFVAIGQVMYQSLPPLLAAIWFPSSERAMATAVASLFGFVGMACGMFYPPYVISPPERDGQKYWGALLGSQFAFSVVLVAIAVPLFRNAPELRPSRTAPRNVRFPMWTKVKLCFCNFNLLLLCGSFGLASGTMAGVAAVLPQVLEPFGVDDSKAGILSLTGIVAGSAACVIAGYWLDRTHRYKITLIALSTCTILVLLPAVVVMKVSTDRGASICMYIAVPLLELLVVPMVPTTMEFAVDMAYPLPESVPSTFVLASMCLVSFIMMLVFSFVLGDYPTRNLAFITVIVALAMCFLCLVGMCFVRERRSRVRAEEMEISEPAADDEHSPARDTSSGCEVA